MSKSIKNWARNRTMKLEGWARNRTVQLILDRAIGNSTVEKNIKKNLHNAYTHSRANGTYGNGVRTGQKTADAFFKFLNTEKHKKNTKFVRGVKNGVVKSTVYWLPGIYARQITRKVRKVKGIENIHRIFKTNNTPTPRR
jgi:hypothetical protein